MWTDELCEEYAEAMGEADRMEVTARGITVIIADGEMDIDLLVSLFE